MKYKPHNYQQYAIDFIVLAGFLPLIPDFLVEAYPRRIVNIHPALLPKYGGKGMWGHHVHEAVKAAGEKETGLTVHWVTPQCDAATVIAQRRVALSPEDIQGVTGAQRNSPAGAFTVGFLEETGFMLQE